MTYASLGDRTLAVLLDLLVLVAVFWANRQVVTMVPFTVEGIRRLRGSRSAERELQPHRFDDR